MNRPFFSVVVTATECPQWLRAALVSVFSQGFTNFEVIVVNDASKHDYGAVLEPFQDRIRYIALSQSAGVSASRNRALDLATGEWVAFLDADDEWLPGLLGQHHLRLSSCPPNVGFGWSSSVRQIFEPGGRTIASHPIRYSEQYLFSSQLEGICITANTRAGLVIRRSCVEKLGGFDERFRLGEVTELVLKLLSRGYRPRLNREVGALVREHPERLSASKLSYLKEQVPSRLFATYADYLCADALRWSYFVRWTRQLERSHATMIAHGTRRCVRGATPLQRLNSLAGRLFSKPVKPESIA